MDAATPMLKQYQDLKKQYQNHILFFRLGDFYEMFYDDARAASPVLNVVLTSRDAGKTGRIPMCGIPYHAKDNYIAKLIKAGFKVAICEQVEDPAQAKGIVKRDVIKVITAGTYIDESSPDQRCLLSLAPDDNAIGFAFMDVLGGHIQANQYSGTRELIELIARLPVSEVIFPAQSEPRIRELFKHPLLKLKTIALSPHDDWCFNPGMADSALRGHFQTKTLRGFGFDNLPLAVAAAGAIVEYAKLVNRTEPRHICRLSLYTENEFVFISPAAVYGLGLDDVFTTIDNTLTPFGKRCLKFWLYHPLKDRSAILQRQSAVTLLIAQSSTREELHQHLRNLPDIDKSITRISTRDASPRDLLALRTVLCKVPAIRSSLERPARDNPLFSLEDIPELRALLESAVNPDMPLSAPEGKVIRPGYHAELDATRAVQENARELLKNMQAAEIKRTGINSLKIGFNNVFGYYIEITRANLSSVPADYVRKQTLANAERFITPELKAYEDKILNAQDRILRLENELIAGISKTVLDHASALNALSARLAALDALYSLSVTGQSPGYAPPDITDTRELRIEDGRHPVVERFISDPFIPNDTLLDCDANHLMLITGPNMAGKSTYIRQTAVIVILAQMGGYVPAKSCSIGLVDKIFTRIGAHDEITRGQSTFMVEMSETAGILNNLSERSLVILDEIGRGTSTYDGLSLAWAIAEHLHRHKTRTLFATHFHELTALAEDHPGIRNYNVAVKEWNDEVVFLHKIVPGSSDDSYGIYVAKLAGIPGEVLERSKEILARLELSGKLDDKIRGGAQAEHQISFIVPPAACRLPVCGEQRAANGGELADEIKNIELNSMTPLEVVNKVQEWKEKLSRHGKNKRTSAGHRQ